MFPKDAKHVPELPKQWLGAVPKELRLRSKHGPGRLRKCVARVLKSNDNGLHLLLHDGACNPFATMMASTTSAGAQTHSGHETVPEIIKKCIGRVLIIFQHVWKIIVLRTIPHMWLRTHNAPTVCQARALRPGVGKADDNLPLRYLKSPIGRPTSGTPHTRGVQRVTSPLRGLTVPKF